MKSKYQIPTGELVDRLTIVNIKIWHLEEKIAKAQIDNDFEKIGKLALQIRIINNDRIELKEEINRIVDGTETGSDKLNFTRL